MEKLLKKHALRALKHLGIPARTKRGRPPLGLAEGQEIWILGPGTEAHEVLVARFREGVPTPNGAGELNLPKLWVAEYFPTPIAERLVAGGDCLVDAVGNAHLRLPGVFVHVLGKRRPRMIEKALEEPVRRPWRRPALRVLFQLLCDPTLAERPHREIAAAGNTAPGTVLNLLNDLELTGNLVRLGGHKRRFIPNDELVEAWIAEYHQKLRPKTLVGRFTPNRPDLMRTFIPKKHRALWGGETAAMLLGADLRPGVTTLYTRRPFGPLQLATKLRPDPNGTVELREVFWADVAPRPNADVVHPILVVADLLAVRDGRCNAAAQYIRDRYRVGLVEKD